MPRRLIEEAFPLKKVSKDSKHEKNVRHGHISTLHSLARPPSTCRLPRCGDSDSAPRPRRCAGTDEGGIHTPFRVPVA